MPNKSIKAETGLHISEYRAPKCLLETGIRTGNYVEEPTTKNLVIVESPAKAKTIKKYLGTGYEVIASNGHVCDLPKSTMGIDVDKDFEPKYITIRGKGDIIAALRKAVKKADKVYLATDPDREGEAISWHLSQTLKLDPKKFSRITFNEITKNAIKESLKNARAIDMNLVDAQQARRVLDRLVGYQISPVLWAKVKSGLSAGRVQSVALRIISDRENEISAFVPTEYWTIDAKLTGKTAKQAITASLSTKNDEKISFSSKAEVDECLTKVKKAGFTVRDKKESDRKRKAPLPFTTSTLQQEAAKQLNFSTSKTMRIAQQLYEGMELGKRGTIGLITYLRTDSTRVSEEADRSVREYIKENIGEKYVAAAPGEDKSGKKIQDAHEAIRPSYTDITPAEVREILPRDHYRLYQLIWKRFVASRMEQAVYHNVTVRIDSGEYGFTAGTSSIVFDGFLSVYKDDEEESPAKGASFDWLVPGAKLAVSDIVTDQHFTQAPAHYTEASLVKALEELGIGRPSTYAPTISTIIARHYVVKENKCIYMTELGEAVNKIMTGSFEGIVDVNFTATMESLLDSIGEGEIEWKTVIRNFYPDLAAAVEEAHKDLEKVKIRDEVSDVPCDLCGRMMVIKYGPHGKFLACPGFPECRNTKPYNEKTGITCPKCGGDILIKKTRKGRRFFGCANHPDCDFVSWTRPDAAKKE